MHAVTIGIPVRDGGILLQRLLQAVFSQETSRPFEVIALDSSASDASLQICAAYPVRVIRISPDAFDWGRLRERLFTEAQGSIVINLSQDAIPAFPDWLEKLLAPLDDHSVGVCCGHSIPDPHRAFEQFAWERNGWFYFTREMKRFADRYGRGMSFANTAVRRSVWEQLHIAPQATGEDFGFQTRLHAAGIRIAFTQEAPVWHHHNYTVRGVYRRCRNEGLALREMGVAYNERDLLSDLLLPGKWVQLAREIRHGRLHNAAEWLYPALRPVAVYHGSRFARSMVWY